MNQGSSEASPLSAQGANVAFVFFGTYCLLLGYLVFRSTFLPRVLGVFLTIAGAGWLTISFASLLAPALGSQLSPYIMPVSGLGELSFCLWLLVAGVNVPRWEQQAGVRISEDT